MITHTANSAKCVCVCDIGDCFGLQSNCISRQCSCMRTVLGIVLQSTPIQYQSASVDSTSWMASSLSLLCVVVDRTPFTVLLEMWSTCCYLIKWPFKWLIFSTHSLFSRFSLHRTIFMFNNIGNHMSITQTTLSITHTHQIDQLSV